MDKLKSEFFKQLTWSDINAWAGDTITSRGRSYQSDGSVQDLAFSHDGGLLAWVQGTERYATLVDIEHENLTSDCTCPYGGTCKHAVAVVLEYLEKVKKNTKVPIANQNDRRMSLLSGITADTSEDEFADHNNTEDFEDSDDEDPDRR